MLDVLRRYKVIQGRFPEIIDRKVYLYRVTDRYIASTDGHLYDTEEQKVVPLDVLDGQIFHNLYGIAEEVNDEIEEFGFEFVPILKKYSVVDDYDYDGSVELSHEEEYLIWELRKKI